MSKRRYLLSSLALGALVAMSAPAYAEARQVQQFDIPAQDLGGALRAFARASGAQVIFDGKAVRGKRSETLRHRSDAEEALRELLRGTGLTYRRNGKIFIVSPARKIAQADPALMASAVPAAATAEAPAQAISDPAEIIVTAQKKAESIQDVPLSVSAFSAAALDEYKIESGSELLRAVPNVTFSKTNFASYNFSIRGIGTKAISVASDPAVAISFNNTPLIRNRLFEQEYFDVERVEVLRGPQGTLYGRNATGGVVNMITNKPKLGEFEAWAKGEVGNYESKRLSGMINVPLGDFLSLRAAGAMTKRTGYDFNTVTSRRVNGRDLWSTRVSAAWEPSDRFRANAIWEHFEEDDNRSRTGKQLCTKDPGPTSFGGRDISADLRFRGILSQGCLPGSIYDDAAYSVPNAFALPHVAAAAIISSLGNAGARGPVMRLIDGSRDPYAGVVQSRDLREISTAIDPVFRAKNDVLQLNVEFDMTDSLRFYSNTSYSEDNYYSFQDYNRVNSGDAFNDSSKATDFRGRPLPTTGISPGGILDDPQLGKSSKILAADQVKSKSDQWYQEFRLQSDFSGKLNFSFGVNYLKFKIHEDYYVFSNLFTALAKTPLGTGGNGNPVRDCTGWTGGSDCTYIDPNPISSLNGNGHNYFRSQNIGSTRSYAAFGELYWKPADDLKITLGLRYTDDKKVATPIDSQLLLGTGLFGFGLINEGYIVSPDIVQQWKRVTGRAVVDWKPDLGFTDDTLLYASFSRGYKGGGTNPPGIGANPVQLKFFPLPKVFKPESVNAFEIGTKNDFASGRLSLNANAFFYDYKDYQVSQIVDRIALNETYDAQIWGAELEAVWRPTPRWRINTNLGYLDTRIADGMKSIDVMNRTQGNSDWIVMKPWIQLASNCIAPRALVEKYFNHPSSGGVAGDFAAFCGGQGNKNFAPGSFYSNMFGIAYDPQTDAPNQGRGFDADLGGNELPNSPHWTFNLGAQYTVPMDDWELTLRGDYYRQGESWARVYNTAIDRLKAWDNTNISITLERPESGFSLHAYVKNIFNNTPITDIFLNSDDSGLTANVFTLDPRIFGFAVTKKF